MPSVITLEGSKKKMKQKGDVPKKGTERCIFNPRTGRGHPQVATGNKRLPWKFVKGSCTPDKSNK